ncbi:hypothetical protein C5167_001073 [Papaver somniferum]|uniref:Uncharacterized protein n=1 Tax=Papaver somniferum TaxID=3469 RepID=A0A4Y7KUC2_PAPSO|nr:hypothetical protein C5167_001073 [Papaver somniferum]
MASVSIPGQGEGSVKETNLVNETVRFAMEYTDASPIGKRVSWQFFSLEMSMGEKSNNAAGLLPNPVADPQTGMRGKLHLINKLHTTHSWAFLEVNVIPQYNQLSTDMEALQNLTAECDLDSKQGSDYGEKEVVEGNVLMLEWLDGWFLCVSVLAVVLLYLEGSDYGEKEVVEGNVLMLEWLDGWFLCVSVLAVVLLYLEVSCWLCCLYAHLNFMSRLNFVGGPMCWNTRTFSASADGEAFCNGQTSHVSETDRVDRSLLVTEFGYEHDDAWATNIYLNNLLISAGSTVPQVLHGTPDKPLPTAASWKAAAGHISSLSSLSNLYRTC